MISVEPGFKALHADLLENCCPNGFTADTSYHRAIRSEPGGAVGRGSVRRKSLSLSGRAYRETAAMALYCEVKVSLEANGCLVVCVRDDWNDRSLMGRSWKGRRSLPQGPDILVGAPGCKGPFWIGMVMRVRSSQLTPGQKDLFDAGMLVRVRSAAEALRAVNVAKTSITPEVYSHPAKIWDGGNDSSVTLWPATHRVTEDLRSRNL